MDLVLAVLRWEPQLRGPVIVLTGMLILMGSVFVILATNLGNRVGFLVAASGLFGWLTLLTMLWTITPSGTGPKGREPIWKVEAVIAGNKLPATARPPLDRFPAGWKKLAPGEKDLAEAQAAVDGVLKGDQGKAMGFGEKTPDGKEHTYELDKGYAKGGDTYFLTLLHKAHYAAVQVRPILKTQPQPGQPAPKPTPDPSQPRVTLLMVRDLGTRRLPPFFAFLGASTILAVLLSTLHRRDKMAMAARAAES